MPTSVTTLATRTHSCRRMPTSVTTLATRTHSCRRVTARMHSRDTRTAAPASAKQHASPVARFVDRPPATAPPPLTGIPVQTRASSRKAEKSRAERPTQRNSRNAGDRGRGRGEAAEAEADRRPAAQADRRPQQTHIPTPPNSPALCFSIVHPEHRHHRHFVTSPVVSVSRQLLLRPSYLLLLLPTPPPPRLNSHRNNQQPPKPSASTLHLSHRLLHHHPKHTSPPPPTTAAVEKTLLPSAPPPPPPSRSSCSMYFTRLPAFVFTIFER